MKQYTPVDTAEHVIWLEPGTRFYSWTVVGTPVPHQTGHKPDRYQCRCECGTVQWVYLYDLLGQRTKHCLRCRSRGVNNSNYRHGDAKQKWQGRLYMVWNGMKSRCHNPNSKDWANYGGRGIKVCEAWLDYRTFRAWATTHGYAEGLTIERRDNDRGYEPGNCCWIPQSAQSGNRRSRYRDRDSGSLFEG